MDCIDAPVQTTRTITGVITRFITRVRPNDHQKDVMVLSCSRRVFHFPVSPTCPSIYKYPATTPPSFRPVEGA